MVVVMACGLSLLEGFGCSLFFKNGMNSEIVSINIAFCGHCIQGGFVRGSRELLKPLIDRLLSFREKDTGRSCAVTR